MHGLTVKDPANTGAGCPMRLPPFRIDILAPIDRVARDGAWSRRHVRGAVGREPSSPGFPGLLQNKRASASPAVDGLERSDRTRGVRECRVLAAVTNPSAVTAILLHLGLDPLAPAPAPARGPPEDEASWAS